MSAAPKLTSFTLSDGHSTSLPFTSSEFTTHYSDSSPLASIIIETLPAHGTLQVAGISITAGDIIAASTISTLIYSPTAPYTGPDSFTWNANDGTNNAANNSAVNINVVETAPLIHAIPLSTSHSVPITFTAADFTSNYFDADGDALSSITILIPPTHGTLLLNSVAVTPNTVIPAASIPNLTYTPNNNFSGSDSFTWSASDGIESSAVAKVTIAVSEHAPVATSFTLVPGEVATGETNGAVSFLNGSSDLFSLQFSDADSGDSLQSIKILSLPAHGNLTITPDGTTINPVTIGEVINVVDIPNLAYTPDVNYVGKDSFKWSASDGVLPTGTETANFDIRYFTVSANNNVITNGDTNPTANAFTDFGYAPTVASSSTGPSVTRTYTITDVGGNPLDLTNLTSLVKISGANASDFVVTTQPGVTSLTTGQSTTFTITFTPSATGTRTALVTIANDALSQSPFTFTIKGTGLTVFTTTDGLMVQATKAGTGTGAVDFDELAVNYTGTLLNGTVFDSSLAAGRTPLQFALGTTPSQVIAGWDEGLVNIKVGETRVLIIPGALAYPNGSPDGSVPPGATILFTITCLQIARPSLVLTGNGFNIPANDKHTSILDGTSFGILPAGSASAVNSFVIQDGGGGELGFPSTGAPVTATDSSGNPSTDFTPSAISFSSDGNTAGFTITFNPSGPGVRTAIIDVHTNDPIHPDYLFTITGTINYTDLSASLGTVVLPTPTANNGPTTLLVPVIVKNIGATPVPSSTPNATITVTVHDSANTDTPLAVFANQNVSGLGLNKTKTFVEKITLPAGFDADNSIITAVITADAAKPILETNPLATDTTTNNTVTGTISSDLVGTLVSTTLLPHVITNAPQNGTITFALENTGTATLSAGQKININIIVVETTTGLILPLANLVNQSIGSLAGGATKTFTITVNKNIELPEGTYDIHVDYTLVPAIPDEDANNNSITLTAANNPLSIQAHAGFDNISGSLVSSTLPANDGNTAPIKGNVVVQLTNAANRALPSGQLVQVEIIAHNLGDDTAADIALGTSGNISLSSWAANKSGNFTIPVTYAGGFEVDHYDIEAEIVPLTQTGKPALVESSTADNLLTVNAANLPITFNAQTPVTNFDVNVLTSNLPTKPASTKLTGTVGVQFSNAGNVPLPTGQQVTIQIIAHPIDATDHTTDIVLQTSAPISVSNLASGAIIKTNVSVSFTPPASANPLISGSYQIEVLIVPVQTLTVANPDDNYGTLTPTNTTIALFVS